MSSPTPFPPHKTIKELGIDVTRKFVVVDDKPIDFKSGDILTLVRDDNDTTPYFCRESDKQNAYCHLSRLAYADEPETPYVPRVGDRVSLEGVVKKIDSEDLINVDISGTFTWYDKNELEKANVKLLSRAPRTLTRSEAEALLKEKLGEDVTIK